MARMPLRCLAIALGLCVADGMLSPVPARGHILRTPLSSPRMDAAAAAGASPDPDAPGDAPLVRLRSALARPRALARRALERAPGLDSVGSAATALRGQLARRVEAAKALPLASRVGCGVFVAGLLATRQALGVLAAADAATAAVHPIALVLYHVQQALIRRAGLTVIVFTLGIIALGGFLLKRTGDYDNLDEATFRAYSVINNVPGADAVEFKTPLGRLISNTLYMTGVLTFAILIGVVSDNISSQVEGLRISNERVLDVKHTVMCNWGEYTRPMLRQLEAARREGRLRGRVVILSEKEKK